MPLSFKQAGNTFIAGPNINIYPSGNNYAISGSGGGGGGTGTIISGTNIGTGVGVFSSVSSTNLVFRTIRAGANAGVFLSGNDIVFSATTGAINGVTAVTTVGSGIAVASGVTAGALISRTISGANGLEAVESGNLVVIRPSNVTTNRFYIAGTGGLLTTNDFFQLDSTVGSAAIGFSSPQTITTTRLLLPPATTAISPLRLTTSSSVASSSLRNGDIQYNTSGNTLYFIKGQNSFGGVDTLTPFVFRNNNLFLTGSSNNRVLQVDSSGSISAFNTYTTPLGIFNSITSTTISGTSELSVINTGSTFLIGTNILNSSTHESTPQLITGKKYRFNGRGSINTDGTPGTLTSKLKLGSVIIASATTTLQTNINGNFFEIDCTFTIRSQGASGKVIGSGKMLTDAAYLASGTSPIAPITSLGEVTINTTVDTAFDFTLQFSDGGNNININEATLEYLN
jgi:hypothetical protein